MGDKRFNAREGLVTFPTILRIGPVSTAFGSELWFQCPRGLGDFSHEATIMALIVFSGAGFNAREGLVTFPTIQRGKLGIRRILVSMPARAW